MRTAREADPLWMRRSLVRDCSGAAPDGSSGFRRSDPVVSTAECRRLVKVVPQWVRGITLPLLEDIELVNNPEALSALCLVISGFLAPRGCSLRVGLKSSSDRLLTIAHDDTKRYKVSEPAVLSG
jgi:hypothetical protein